MDTTATLIIRPATPDDVDAILSVWELAAMASGTALDSDGRAKLGAHLRASLRHPRMLVLCAVEGDRLAGYATAHVDVHPTMDGALGVIDELFVHPAARRRGTGRALLTDVAGRLGAKGVHGIRTEVHPADDVAGAFAFSTGFERGAQLWHLRPMA
ncbi:MAG: mshD [Solirubrobacterales bacterium]|nr:mshD [Solirubrobacterales bacterium]